MRELGVGIRCLPMTSVDQHDQSRQSKASLRAHMRRVRKDLPDREERSARIWAQVRELPAIERAQRVLVFDTIPGEPHADPFAEWCRVQGKAVAVPEDDVGPSWPDVVIVPGLAFTERGERLGQGGGWYDRFLSRTRDGCTTIGVCFDPQLVDELPTEDHDVVLDIVVSDAVISG